MGNFSSHDNRQVIKRKYDVTIDNEGICERKANFRPYWFYIRASRAVSTNAELLTLDLTLMSSFFSKVLWKKRESNYPYILSAGTVRSIH